MKREDLFTPAHKAFRSMIYETGKELQTTDFRDIAETELVSKRLEDGFKFSSSACVICWLELHANHENDLIFPAIQEHEPGMVEGLLAEHREIERKFEGIRKLIEELGKTKGPHERLEIGDKLNQFANDFFEYYLAHMNKEEKTVLPATWKYLSDEQLAAIHSEIVKTTPRERVPDYFKWFLISVNMNELASFISGLKKDMPPPVFDGLSNIAKETLGEKKWSIVLQNIEV